MTILAIHRTKPNWPADPSRPIYEVDGLFVETDGPRPTAEEISAAITPSARRLVPKSLIISRLTDQQLDAALAALSPRQKERWRAPDKPAVYHDDPDVLAILGAIGANAEHIMRAEE